MCERYEKVGLLLLTQSGRVLKGERRGERLWKALAYVLFKDRLDTLKHRPTRVSFFMDKVR